MYKILGTDQKEYGPVTADQLRQWVREGRANGQSLVQGPDSTEWKPLSNFPEFADAMPAATAAPAPGSYAAMGGAQPHVPNYLWQSIVVTLCCCPNVIGIPAIIYASQVNTKLALGDMAGAMEASKNARLWCWIAFGVGIVAGIGMGCLQLMGVALQGLNL